MKKLLTFILVILLVCTQAVAEEMSEEEIQNRSLLVKEMINGDPNSKGSLNMEKPFSPIRMEASSLKGRDKAFFLNWALMRRA